jgi:hypothetical protein
MAAGDGEAVRPKLGIDVGELWCSSGEDEGTKGGDGLQRSFRDSQFSTGGGLTVWQ